MRLIRRVLWAITLIIVISGAAIVSWPLGSSIDAVSKQPTEPLPEPFRVALRFALSADGSPWAIRLQVARLVTRQGPRDGILRLVKPPIVALRLAIFTDIIQSEHLVAQTYRARCWTKGYTHLTVPDALYLAARVRAPSIDSEAFIRGEMTRIAERVAAQDPGWAQDFIAAASGPLPVCG